MRDPGVYLLMILSGALILALVLGTALDRNGQSFKRCVYQNAPSCAEGSYADFDACMKKRC